MGAEYASIDLKKKSRHSADLEARRRSANANATVAGAPQGRAMEEPEEEVPPPVPEKVLDENDNQPGLINGLVGAGLHNGEVRIVGSLSLMVRKRIKYLLLNRLFQLE